MPQRTLALVRSPHVVTPMGGADVHLRHVPYVADPAPGLNRPDCRREGTPVHEVYVITEFPLSCPLCVEAHAQYVRNAAQLGPDATRGYVIGLIKTAIEEVATTRGAMLLYSQLTSGTTPPAPQPQAEACGQDLWLAVQELKRIEKLLLLRP